MYQLNQINHVTEITIFRNAFSVQQVLRRGTYYIPALGIGLTNPLQLPYFGCAPPPYFGSRFIVSWDKPSLYGSLSFSFLFLVLSWLGFDPGSLRVFVNTLTMVSFLILLSGSMIRPVYIVVVWLIGAKHPMLQLKRLFFVTKKNFF